MIKNPSVVILGRRGKLKGWTIPMFSPRILLQISNRSWDKP